MKPSLKKENQFSKINKNKSAGPHDGPFIFMTINLIRARLIQRKNRFVASVLIDNTETEVYVPNTGRLSELAIPGARCLLAESSGRYRYKLLYIFNNGFPVMIDSTLSNSLFAELLVSKKVPGLEKFKLLRREPVYGRHRFDFLIAENKNSCYVELKSCTLFYRDVASFPDAVSSRASEHIRELAKIPESRLVILVLNNSAEVFIPNYHTDYEFYKTLKENSDRIVISSFRIDYNDQLEIKRLFPVPVIIPEVSKKGFFFMVISDDNNFYIYISGECSDVFDEIKKIKRRRSALKDSLFSANPIRILKDFPVITDNLSTGNTIELFTNSGGIKIKGTSSCSSRVFRFKHNPLEQRWFHEHVLKLRFSPYTSER